MKINSISVYWTSNGRTLPTQAEREMMEAAIKDAAHTVAGRCDSAEQIEDYATSNVRTAPDRYGIDSSKYNARDIDRILADCSILIS